MKEIHIGKPEKRPRQSRTKDIRLVGEFEPRKFKQSYRYGNFDPLDFSVSYYRRKK